jgi:hypothetical protein
VLRHQSCSHRLSLRNYKRLLSEFELPESMHLFAPAGEVVLTHGVALNL